MKCDICDGDKAVLVREDRLLVWDKKIYWVEEMYIGCQDCGETYCGSAELRFNADAMRDFHANL